MTTATLGGNPVAMRPARRGAIVGCSAWRLVLSDGKEVTVKTRLYRQVKRGGVCAALIAAAFCLVHTSPQQARSEQKSRICALEGSEITTDTNLEPGCTYQNTITIVGSDLTLDCRGAWIDLAYRETHGIRIGWDRMVRNVKVKNCHIDRARGSGIWIGLGICDGKKGMSGTLYGTHPHSIVLEDVSVRHSATVGIYIDDHVRNTMIVRALVERNASTGIYLEHDSHSTTIRHSRILRNGYGKEITPFARDGRREGIAIDASWDNRIEENEIAGNFGGGIYLYRNCWEHHTDACQVRRWRGASNNIVHNNRIQGGRVGVWIAARQSIDPAQTQLRSRACAHKRNLHG